MTDIESLRELADEAGAVIVCNCGYEEPFREYLEREDRLNYEDKEVEFVCPACGSDVVDLSKVHTKDMSKKFKLHHG